jgi:pimeloyl-ACP methyl ester carboxylesterase
VRYARSGDASIVYQVLGDRGPDLLFVPGFAAHLDLAWEEPHLARFLRGLARIGRLIWFDKRGTGLSDPARAPQTLSEAAADLGAVLLAAGAERAVLFGVAVGAAICTSFALDHPDRVGALVLWGAHARLLRAPGYPAGWTEEEFLAAVRPGSTTAGPARPGSR